MLCAERGFGVYWYETGTPSFLLKLLRQRQTFLPELESLQTTSALLGTFDVDNIPLEALLFQAGYLTIGRQMDVLETVHYRPRYQNREVRQSLNENLLTDWLPEARMGVLKVARENGARDYRNAITRARWELQ